MSNPKNNNSLRNDIDRFNRYSINKPIHLNTNRFDRNFSPLGTTTMLNMNELPILPEHDRSSKEACLKYYNELKDSIQKQIEINGIIPTIPDEMLESLKANYCENAEAEILDFVARPILDFLDEHYTQMNAQMDAIWETILLQAMMLDQITPEYLAEKASKKPQNFIKIQKALQNPILMSQFIDGGEPKNGNYPKTLDIYLSILNHCDRAKSGAASNDIFHRLALAVALEFAKPVHIFDTKIEIDPVVRYLHYEKAYVDGELDPCFPTMTTWELRMVVNNDASDDEICWCRRMLRNYRPDHILDRNYHWRYCMVVKTEVEYKVPDWKHFPKTYKQLISGGGKCGPRAWFGRYALRSFGIPTWGVRQPGHAALSHYMPPEASNEWVICLGGPNWKKSFWENRKGTHFYWESVARRRCPKEFECIKWMTCFARMAKENCVENEKPDGLKNLWTQLKWLKMRQLASIENFDNHAHGVGSYYKPDDKPTLTLIEQIRDVSDDKSKIKYMSNGNISIPASCASDVPKQNVIVTKSFHEDGGNQLHLRQNTSLKYSIVPPKEVKGRNQYHFKYHLSCRIVTVHADTSPLILQTKTVLGTSSYEISIPYSCGEWITTEPIEISLLEGNRNELCFSRDNEKANGLTIKDFTLTRLN